MKIKEKLSLFSINSQIPSHPRAPFLSPADFILEATRGEGARGILGIWEFMRFTLCFRWWIDSQSLWELSGNSQPAWEFEAIHPGRGAKKYRLESAETASRARIFLERFFGGCYSRVVIASRDLATLVATRVAVTRTTQQPEESRKTAARIR